MFSVNNYQNLNVLDFFATPQICIVCILQNDFGVITLTKKDNSRVITPNPVFPKYFQGKLTYKNL